MKAAREYPGTIEEIIDDPPPSEPPEPKRGSPRITITQFNDIRLNTSPNYVVKGIIPRDGLTIVWGPPKCGKSFWTYDLTMHIALGRSYRGHRVRQGTVGYIAFEGGGGFANRIEAWRRRNPTDDRVGAILSVGRLDQAHCGP